MPIDLSSAAVGDTGEIDFSQFVKVAANNPNLSAYIWLYNDSGCGLDIAFQASGNQHHLPAGGWGALPLAFNDSKLTVTVTYVLPNPPVSKLSATYYAPGEQVPASYTLGNSPIGGETTVSGGIASELINTGNPSGFTIITATPFGDVDVATLVNNNGTMQLGNRTSRDGQIAVYGPLSLVQVDGQVQVGDPADIILEGTTGKIFLNQLILPVGSFQAVSFFKVSLTTTLTGYLHGLGQTPDFVAMTLLGTSTTTATIKYDDLTMTSTTVKMIASVNCTAACLAVKL